MSLPERLRGFTVCASAVERVDNVESPFSCLFDAEGMPRTDRIFLGFPDAAGVDVAYWVVQEIDGELFAVLVLVQCKAGDAELVDAVRSVTPAWQYVEKKQRDALARHSAGEALTKEDVAALKRTSKQRAAFWDLADQHEQWFSSAVRVVVTSGDVEPAAARLVTDLNRHLAEQEVLLASLTGDWLGESLATALRRLCGVLSVDGRRGRPLAYQVLPQTFRGVRATWESATKGVRAGVGGSGGGGIEGGSETMEKWLEARSEE
jgi:hypothetical protein